MKHHAAPWSRSLTGMTLVAAIVGIGSAGFLLARSQVSVGAAVLPAVLVAAAAPFLIRGYDLAADAVLVRRLFWTTRVSKDRLIEARYEPDALRGSLRLFGNGGLFVFAGWFWNRRLGRYRALVTDPRRAVVLLFPGRTVVLSPAEPEVFVNDLRTAAASSGQP